MDSNHSAALVWNATEYDPTVSVDADATIPTYGLVSFQIVIAVIYSLVCTVGLLGNFFVMYLIRAKRVSGLTAIDIFVFCLALSDFQFAFTLPFWAGDAIMDFSWRFGHPMCKIVLTMTVLSVYYNVFLLTAMAVTRYWLVASALSLTCTVSTTAAKWISFALWLLALAATVPTIIFASTKQILGDELCLLKFPEKKWLAIYHVQRFIMAFVIPLIVISTSYISLLNFLRQHRVNANNQHRQSKITNSIQLVIIVFFVCWFPNHAGIFWGILMKFEVVHWSDAYYYFHTYVYPITICLAHSNSCLNPVIYCLMRKEFRKLLWALLRQLKGMVMGILPSAKRSNMDQETEVPLYRKSSLPHTNSREYHGPSVSTITILHDMPAKDQRQCNGATPKQETAMDYPNDCEL
ncbi:PREDICTED: relaxin-3 receptor 2-like [Nanorana parkeri]|uniref:relaxin-3 receptor 2-like n=1 Tax=Nanorana parkeri TaxID=125878 RepID=UPI000854EC3D|nr:PREDICTED: relaxin-3 receptor 2-like [Nanorana parkeri]